MKSHDDPIVAEVRATREKLAARHGNSVKGIFEHLRKLQRSSGRKARATARAPRDKARRDELLYCDRGRIAASG